MSLVIDLIGQLNCHVIGCKTLELSLYTLVFEASLHMHVPIPGFHLFFLTCDANNVCRYFSVVLHKPNK